MAAPKEATHYHESGGDKMYYQFLQGRWYVWKDYWDLSANVTQWHDSNLVSIDFPPSGEKVSVLDVQEGGNHYKGQALQPWEIINSNNLDFYEGNALKYLLRHKDKNGVEDLDKAIHYLQAIKEFHYGQ